MPRVENPALTQALAEAPIPDPPEIRVSPDNKSVAIKDTVQPWFVFTPGNGGQYADDAAVEGWSDAG